MQRRSFLNSALLASAGTLLVPKNTWGTTKINNLQPNNTLLLITGHLNQQNLFPFLLPVLKKQIQQFNLSVNIFSNLVLDKPEATRENAFSVLLNEVKDANWCTTNFGQIHRNGNTTAVNEIDFIKQLFQDPIADQNSFSWVNGFDTECVHYNPIAFQERLKEITTQLTEITQFIFSNKERASNVKLLIIPEHGLNTIPDENGNFHHHNPEALSSFGIEIRHNETGSLRFDDTVLSYSDWTSSIVKSPKI